MRDCKPLYLGLQDAAEHGPWESDTAERLVFARRLAEQRFLFLNAEVRYSDKVDWQDAKVSQLWRYHLHYFDYVEDLLLWAASGNDALAWECFLRMVDSWIGGNERIAGDGWHPFTISVRVVNWLNAFYFWKARFGAELDFSRRFTTSLCGQAQILASSLEYDVRGNHLLKNLRTLIWCGTAIDTTQAGKWMSLAMKALERELAEQVLGDGGHFERAPGYHGAVLKDCIEIGLWLRRNRAGDAAPWLDEALLRMLRYLVSILPPDGELPLLKDTALGVTPPPKDLLAAGALYFENPEFKISDEIGIYPLLLFGRKGWETFQRWPIAGRKVPSASLPDSGYFIMRNPRTGDYLIFDGGKVCPDYLPAHAHADMFSYELTVQGRRVVVDSGIYEYSAGGWRNYFRSTRAHNTVEIEGQNQSEVWGSFRVAKRARPFQVLWQTGEDYDVIDARHDGFLRLTVPLIHRRVLLWVKGAFWLVVDEILEVRERSELKGLDESGSVRAESFVHLHPSIQPVEVDCGHWRLEGMPECLWIQAFGHGASQITTGQTEPSPQGWYSERFGERVPNSVLSIHRESNLPFLFGYAISNVDKLVIDVSGDRRGEREIIVRDRENNYRLIIERNGVRILS